MNLLLLALLGAAIIGVLGLWLVIACDDDNPSDYPD